MYYSIPSATFSQHLITLFTVHICFCFACLKGWIQNTLLTRLMSDCALPVFPSRVYGFGPNSEVLTPFYIHFGAWCESVVQLTLWASSCPVSSAPFLEEAAAAAVRSRLLSRRLAAPWVWACFWALSCPFHASVSVPVPCSVGCSSFAVQFDVRGSDSFSFAYSFLRLFCLLGSSVFPYEF